MIIVTKYNHSTWNSSEKEKHSYRNSNKGLENFNKYSSKFFSNQSQWVAEWLRLQFTVVL